jgi:hypothetical protein
MRAGRQIQFDDRKPKGGLLFKSLSHRKHITLICLNISKLITDIQVKVATRKYWNKGQLKKDL